MGRPRRDRSESDNGDVMFINVSHPDQVRRRETQRTIRRRVMRDIGKSRRREGRRPLTVDIIIPEDTVFDDTSNKLVTHDTDHGPWRPLEPDVSKSLQPYGYYAIEPDARARQLFHFMTGSAGDLYRPFRLEWFASAIADRCSFYLCLANGAMFYHRMLLDGKSLEYSDYEESASYFGRCTGLLARRLDCPKEGVSEGVVNTVLGFLCHDAAVGKLDRWVIHMAGLRRIVQLRQGFSGLSHLTHMLAFWFELTGCAMLDAAPWFPVPPGLPQSSVLNCGLSRALTDILSSLTIIETPPLSEACMALEHTARVACYLNISAHRPQFWEDGMRVTQILGPAAHYALTIPRLTVGDGCVHVHTAAEALSEMLRLAILTLLARLKTAFSLIARETAVYQTTFLGILTLAPEASDVCPELGLWCMLVVAGSYGRDAFPHPLTLAIREAMTRMSLGTAAEAIQVARSIIWVQSIMDSDTDQLVLEIGSTSVRSGT